jgi:hypothetical protein
MTGNLFFGRLPTSSLTAQKFFHQVEHDQMPDMIAHQRV